MKFSTKYNACVCVLVTVTGVNVHVITPILCVICVFYTCVVWAFFFFKEMCMYLLSRPKIESNK